MAKYLLSFALIMTSLTAVTGCSGGGTNTSVGENADAKALADYEAAQKASEQAMNESMKQAPPANP